MEGKADVAGNDSNAAQSLVLDREEVFKEWQRKRDRSQKLIGVTAWIGVMIAASMFGFWLGAIAKHGL